MQSIIEPHVNLFGDVFELQRELIWSVFELYISLSETCLNSHVHSFGACLTST